MLEEKINETGVQVEDNTQDYLAAINELKQNSVDRSKYDQLRAENKRLINSIVNGTAVDVEQPKSKPDIQALRNELFNDEPKSNLEYITKALELRDALIENGETDPFLPQGAQITHTDEDVANANRLAEGLRHCVEYAEGDNQVFTNELQRITQDVRVRR